MTNPEIPHLPELITLAWMLFGIYTLVLLLVIADLWSGIRKARMRGEIRSSSGYRKTISKVAKYYNVLLALTLVDCMQMGSIWYLDSYYGYHVPIFPLITLIGAIGIGLIEIKSIYEKAEDKVKFEYQQVALLLSRIAHNKSEPKEVTKAVFDYMNKELIKTKDDDKATP